VKILVDGEAAANPTAGGEPLVELYRRAVAELLAQGRTVVSTSVDGRILVEDELTKVLDGESDGEALNLQTVATAELAGSTLKEVAKHVARLREGLRRAVDRLGADDRTGALEAFRPTLEMWMAVCEAVQKVCIVIGHDVAADLDGTSVADEHRKIVDALGEIQSAFEQQDWVKLGDLLEYEMLPATDRWEAVVNRLLHKVQADGRA